MAPTVPEIDPAVMDHTSLDIPAGVHLLENTGDAELDHPARAALNVPNDVKLDFPLIRSVQNHSLEFRIAFLHDDDDPWWVEWLMFNVINAFLQPDAKLSANEAARCLDSVLPENRPDSPEDPDDDKEDAQNFMFELCSLIWKIAKQIPHDHESQAKLVQLIQALRRLPVTVTTELNTGEHRPIWRENNFDGWDQSIRHAFGDAPSKSGPQQGKTQKQECIEYININAFAARIQAARVMSARPSYAFSAIAEAIAPIQHQRVAPELRPTYIIAGAQWMAHAAEWFWDEIRWGSNSHISTFESHEASNIMALPPSRWVKWMQDFQNIETKDEVARFWAGEAANSMEMVMIDHGYTAGTMEGWDPKNNSVHAGLWEDPRYAHLFKEPMKAKMVDE